jgi:hypothetical protein
MVSFVMGAAVQADARVEENEQFSYVASAERVGMLGMGL